MKRIQDLAHSLPKLLSLPQCTRNKTDPDPRLAPATPSLPTWGNGPGALTSAGAGRAGPNGRHCQPFQEVQHVLGWGLFWVYGEMLSALSHTASFLRIRVQVTWRVSQHDTVMFRTNHKAF